MDITFAAQDAVPSCSKHNDELQSFCNTCGKRVCEECIKGDHKGHDWSLKTKFTRQAKRNGTTNHDAIQEKALSILKSKLNIRKSDKTKIDETREKLKRIVDEYADSLLEKMDSLDGNDSELQSEIDEMETFADFFKEGIQEAHDNVIMEMQENLHIHLKKYKSPNLAVRGKFKQGKINAEQIHSMFGRIKEKKKFSTHQKSTVTIKSVSTITYGKKEVGTIRVADADSAYIHYGNEKHMTLISHKGLTQDTVMMTTEVSDVLVFTDNIVYSSTDDKVIHRISLTSKNAPKQKWSTAPLYPRGLCLSHDQMILVCLGDRPASDMKDTTKGEVGQLSMSRGLQMLNKEEGRAQFVSPYRIAQNNNDDICVVDILDQDYRSRLVAITNTGQLRFTYNGQSSLKERFVSHDVCCDLHGRIILPDYYNGAVHMLNSDGLFIQFLSTRSQPLLRSLTEALPRLRSAMTFLPVDNSVQKPRSVAAYNDTFWVGCNEGVIKIFTIENK